ncbi:(deoxy)nucleoside triphosphate pyrophosphohydrolase [bacterium]|jgi:8-oxo-dGTP diphosphatase|nr:(deoxy)nucleoside triphosphate pyrophosphohydrolase [bacterium]MDC3255436.1 (deoxy)nucleoside triphosphate pyrophosphohydrolase [bacterium]
MIKVTCGLIFSGDKIFLCRRNPKKSLGGYWEFPGGKVEPQESLHACLERELQEELDMKVDVISHFLTIQHHYEDFSIELISFLCDFKSSTFSMKDHDAYKWVDPKSILNWDLAPADIPIAKALIELKSTKHTTSRCSQRANARG